MTSVPSNLAPQPDPDGVFQRHAGEVYGWAYRFLGRHHDAADVSQEVFLRWLLQGRLDEPANPRPWLRRVAINRAIDLLRSRRAQREVAASAAPELAARAAFDPAELDEIRAAVAAAMEPLTAAQRSVLVAKVYDGLTFAQIAAEQNLAVPTVKTHYLRALRAVRQRLTRSGLAGDFSGRSTTNPPITEGAADE